MNDQQIILQLPKQLLVCIVNLGCPKNRVDAELMAGQLIQSGCKIVEDPKTAHAVIINTCTFIKEAIEESTQWFKTLEEIRSTYNKELALIVTGCVPQYFKARTLELFPTADAIAGVGQITNVFELLVAALAHRQITNSVDKSTAEKFLHIQIQSPPQYLHTNKWPRALFAPLHYTYIKIAEGCSHGCSYCIIPLVRGKYRSRSIADIVEECQQAVRNGAKELNIIAQDTTAYNSPQPWTNQDGSLATLLQAIQEIPGTFWIRILYTHPKHWTDELIATIRHSKKIVPYADIPLQHINNFILGQMNRGVTRSQIEELLSKIRSNIPQVVIRTSFIVGFPGETEEMFQELLDFVRTFRFDRLGAFKYSPMPGTRAAKLPNQVPEEIKQYRFDKLMRLQKQIATEANQAMVGKTIEVLADCHLSWPSLPPTLQAAIKKTPVQNTPKYVTVARSTGDAPEIDTNVYIPEVLPIGQFRTIKIVGFNEYDLIGTTNSSHLGQNPSKRTRAQSRC